MTQVRTANNMSAGKTKGQGPACRPRYRWNNSITYYSK